MSERISRREWLGSAAAGAAAMAIVGCQPTAKRDEKPVAEGVAASQPAGLDRAKVGDWTAMIHKASGAEAVEVKFSQKLVRRQRFTANSLGEAAAGSTDTVRIRAIVGEKRGEAVAESFSEEAMAAAAKKAAEAAAIADAPAALPKIEPQFYPILPTDRFETRRATAERLAADAEALRRILAEAKVAALGDISTSLEAVGVGTSYGVVAFERRTEARLELRIGEGPGQLAVSLADRSIDDLGAIEALRAMLPLVAAAGQAAPLPMGEFPVIFAPAATASLMRLVTRSIADTPDAVNASVLADRLGQAIVDSRLTLRHRPEHPSLLGCSFDDDGLASEFHTWIERGVLRRLRSGRGNSGAAPMAAPHAWLLSYEGATAATAAASGPGGAVGSGSAPQPGNDATLLASLADLIAATSRGLVVLDFAVLATTQGADLPLLAARVGGPALVIDDGKIVGGVTGVALEESVISLFNRIDAATPPLPTLDVTRSQKWLAPAIRVTDVACGVA
ncbi:MAG: hypothetical protein IT450_20265 [Phycisphaerales bacterium]|nr:hypothetical protein [Phycisphaerales bacterium]